MTFTIYTLGDIHMMEMVLNSVAMIFNPSLELLGGGGSLGFGIVIGVALLLSLVFALIKIFQNQQRAGDEIKGILTVIVLAYVFVVPKSTVQIEDVYSGQVTTVDNVPTGIALTGSLLSGFSRSLAERIETAFQSASSTYVPLSEATFGNPFQIALSIYNNFPRSSGYIKQNIRAYMSDCFNGNGSDKDWMNAKNIIDYITDPANRISAGSTTYYSSGVPNGELVTCADAANRLKVEAQGAISLTSSDLLDAARKGAKLRPDGTQIDSSDLDRSLTLAQFISNASASQVDVTANLALGRIATCAKQCLGQSANNAEYASCNTQCTGDVLMGNTLDQFMIDSSANAGIFQKIAIPMMSLLVGLFYALTPIVIVVAAAKGVQALPYLGKFFLFGVWTQSFLPTAALINAIGQMIPFDMMSGGIANLDGNPGTLTLEETVLLKEAMRNRLISTTELMAYAPLISMAVLTGSYYGLTQLANRISNNDRFNEKNLAPDLTGSAPIYQHSALVAGTATQSAMMIEGGMSYFNNTPMGAASGISINGSQAVSALHSAAHAYQTQAQEEIRKAAGLSINKAVEQGKLSQFASSMGAAFANSESKEVRDTYEEALDTAEKMGFRGEYAKRAAAIMTLAASTSDTDIGKALSGLIRFAKKEGAFSEKAAASFLGVAGWNASLSGTRQTERLASEINEHMANDLKRWSNTLSNSSNASKSITKGFNSVAQGSAGIHFSDQERAELTKGLSHAETAINKAEEMEQRAEKLEIQGTLKDLQIVRAAGNGDLIMGSSKLKQLAHDHGATQEDLNAIAKRRGFEGAGSDGMAALYYLNQKGRLDEVAGLIGGYMPKATGNVAQKSANLFKQAEQVAAEAKGRVPDEKALRQQSEKMGKYLSDKGVKANPELNTDPNTPSFGELMVTSIYNNDISNAIPFASTTYDLSGKQIPQFDYSGVKEKGKKEFDNVENSSVWNMATETVRDMAHSDPVLMSIMASLGLNKLAGAASEAIGRKELEAVKDSAKKAFRLSKGALIRVGAAVASAASAEGLTAAGAGLLTATGVAASAAAVTAGAGVAAFGAVAWSSLTEQERDQVEKVYENQGAFEAYKTMATMAMRHWNSDVPEQSVPTSSHSGSPTIQPLLDRDEIDAFAQAHFGFGNSNSGASAPGGQGHSKNGISLSEAAKYFSDAPGGAENGGLLSAGSPVSQPGASQKRRYTTKNVGN